jgi:hypothetical protein
MVHKRSFFSKKSGLRFLGDDKCAYCGVDLASLSTPRHLDHVVPRSRGGSDLHGNRLFVCQPCNLMKGPRTLESVRPMLLQKRIGWPQFTKVQLSWLRRIGFNMAPYDNAKLWFEDREACQHLWQSVEQYKQSRQINSASAVLSFGA